MWKYLAALVLSTSLVGCDKLSNVVQLNFNDTDEQQRATGTAFVGMLSASGSQTSGQFKLEAGIANQVPIAVQTNGSFKFYGGIQGQVYTK